MTGYKYSMEFKKKDIPCSWTVRKFKSRNLFWTTIAFIDCPRISECPNSGVFDYFKSVIFFDSTNVPPERGTEIWYT